jgi:KTSC domain
MAEEDDLQNRGFQQGVNEPSPVVQVVGGAAAVLEKIAGGIFIRANELLALADRAGTVTLDFDSSCIRTLHYNLRTGAMAVTFTDGSVYPYPPVTMVDFLSFINAESKGSYYNRYVRGKWG